MSITPSRPSLRSLISHCPHLHPSLPGQRLGISSGVYKDRALISLLLLFKQPHLPGADSPPSAASLPTPPAASPPASEKSPRDIALANRNLASSPRRSSHPTGEIQPPTSPRANQNSGSTFRPRRSARLNPGLDQVCAIKGPPGTLTPQSQKYSKMARTYPLSPGYNQCLGVKEEPLSFSSVCLEDLCSGDLEYLSTTEQLVNALPKTEGPASRFALSGHVTPPGHQRLRHSM